MCACRRASRPIRRATRSRRRSTTRSRAARVELSRWREEGERVIVDGRRSTRPIDERITRYLDRSSTFEDAARRRQIGADGLTDDALRRRSSSIYFLFGTDNTGRDLLTRTLIAGRVSLAIGLLAGFVAVVIGVAYGATSGYLGGQRRRGHDAHRRHPLFAALHLLRHPARRLLRPEFRPDVHRRRRGAVARHGAHRPRPDAVDQAAGICAGGRGARRLAGGDRCAATSSRTRSARWSST